MRARRAFLSRAALLTAGAALSRVAPALAAEKAPSLIARHLFFVRADYASVQLSPDGTRIAYLAPANGILNVFVAPVSAPQKGRQVTRVTDRDVSFRIEWAYDNRHIVFFRDRDGDENWRASSVNVETGDVKVLTPETGVRTLVQEVSHLFPTEMLLRHNARDRQYLDVYRVNVVTGESQLVFENKEFAWLVTDSEFRVRLVTRYRSDGSIDVLERGSDGNWSPFMHVPIEDVDSLRLSRLQPRRQHALHDRLARPGQSGARHGRHVDPAPHRARRGHGSRYRSRGSRSTNATPDRRARGERPRALARRRGQRVAGSLALPGVEQRRPVFLEPQPGQPQSRHVRRTRQRERRVCAARSRRRAHYTALQSTCLRWTAAVCGPCSPS